MYAMLRFFLIMMPNRTQDIKINNFVLFDGFKTKHNKNLRVKIKLFSNKNSTVIGICAQAGIELYAPLALNLMFGYCCFFPILVIMKIGCIASQNADKTTNIIHNNFLFSK